MTLDHQFVWAGSSGDPRDEQFGDVVEPAALDDADAFDAVLVGEPYDGAVIGRPGAREGPAAIREALAATKTHHVDAGPVGSVGDLGTVAIPRGESVATVQAAVSEVAARVHDARTLPVFLGGDNSLTYPNVAPLLEGSGDERTTGASDGAEGGSREDSSRSVGVVNLDAHLDVRTVDDQPSSGTPYRQLLDAGLDGLAVLGARHFETSTAYVGDFREAGGEIVTAEEVGADPVEATDRALATLDHVETLYVSVDLDVLDASAAPGVSAPTPGGITSRELFRALRLLASDDRIAGLELVETAPPLCPDGRTAAVAARAVAHALAVAGEATSRRTSDRPDPAEGGGR